MNTAQLQHYESLSQHALENIYIKHLGLVYVLNLPDECYDENVLTSNKWFGKFGDIKRSHIVQKYSCAFVEYYQKDDAINAIQSMDGFKYMDPQNHSITLTLKVNIGCKMYCKLFLKNINCDNLNCEKLHYWANDRDVVYKNDLKNVNNIYIKQHLHQSLTLRDLQSIQIKTKYSILARYLKIDDENILKSDNWFGQFGVIKNIVVSKDNYNNLYQVLIVYDSKLEIDINYVQNVLNDSTLTIEYATNRYCSRFCRKIICNGQLNAKCPFIHQYISISADSLEYMRSDMQIIAQNEYKFDLTYLPNIYRKYLNKNIRNVYNGKMKELMQYFNDLFDVINYNDYSVEIISKKTQKRSFPKQLNDPNNQNTTSNKIQKHSFSGQLNDPNNPNNPNMSAQIVAEQKMNQDVTDLRIKCKQLYNEKEEITLKYNQLNDKLLGMQKQNKEIKSNYNAIKNEYETLKLKYNKQLKQFKSNKDILLKDKSSLKFRNWLINIVRLEQYLKLFQKYEYNDVSFIEFLDEDTLRNELKITKKLHYKLIMKNVETYKKAVNAFNDLLDNNDKLNEYRNYLTQNRILTLYDLQNDINTIKDVKNIFGITDYNRQCEFLKMVKEELIT